MKLFHNIHLWLSVPFGLIITLICFSGAMLIFEPEITRNIKSDIYYVSSSKGDPVPMEKLMETVKATLPDSVSIRYVALNILHATQQAKQKRLFARQLKYSITATKTSIIRNTTSYFLRSCFRRPLSTR